MTSRKDLVEKTGKMELIMKAILRMAKSMAMALTSGLTRATIVELGIITTLKDMGLTNGQMVENTKDVGKITSSMDSILTTKNKALEFTRGLMGVPMTVSGMTGSNMDRANLLMLRVAQRQAIGKMEYASGGVTTWRG
jgi:hypothetical protein